MATDGDQILERSHGNGAEGPRVALADIVALLDADDYLLPDRFKPIFARHGWDMIADNIVFVPEDRQTSMTHEDVERPVVMEIEVINQAAFLLGNISEANGHRGEMGFLKPVMSRAFLVRHGLRYDSRMRLGEDFRLYFEMLLAGARFEVLPSVGYVARVRQNSLSGRHSATDLRNLLVASTELAGRIEDDAILYPAMAQYLDALRRRYLLHDFLEVKRNFGLSRAARRAFSPPRNALPIASGVFRDKWISLLGQSEHPVPPKRYLFPIR